MRTIVYSLFILSLLLQSTCKNQETSDTETEKLKEFLINKDELVLKYSHAPGERKLSFKNSGLTPEEWKIQARDKLAGILDVTFPVPGKVKKLRSIGFQGVTLHALVMEVDENLSIPAYLLEPETVTKSAVMAIHGHGSVEPAIGLADDYHHMFALELARNGHLVLAPELRGFSTLSDLARHKPINRLDYWVGYSQFTLVTDGFLYGSTLIGETVDDLLRWEEWLAGEYGIHSLDVTGISYGGDLAITYPVFSDRTGKIFASGTLGSFDLIFQRCYNAPAHCIPGILEWMDRSDIAGLNAPSPIAIHYGELDVPSETNASASYNESVPQSIEELRQIYAAFGAADVVKLLVTKGSHHEMDIPALLKFFNE
jgi:dienelactone hydrolase